MRTRAGTCAASLNPLVLEERVANMISDRIIPRLVPELEILSWRRSQVLPGAGCPGVPKPEHYLNRERRGRSVRRLTRARRWTGRHRLPGRHPLRLRGSGLNLQAQLKDPFHAEGQSAIVDGATRRGAHPFAEALGISVHTLRNWEQGRRTPEGAGPGTPADPLCQHR